MSLPQPDLDYLNERGTPHTISIEGNMVCIVLPGFELPSGYDRKQADLLLRLNPGFPDVPPDMWWFDPPVRREDGDSITATDSHEVHVGRTWQRWSRHLNATQWKSGIDRLENFIGLIRGELIRCVSRSNA
jgi:hypothetical protein